MGKSLQCNKIIVGTGLEEKEKKIMFEKAKLEIYELDLTDIIVTSDPNANFGDEDDDIVIWPKK